MVLFLYHLQTVFTGVNIESSATCNLHCRMCPTYGYPAHSKNGYMNPKTFELALPSFAQLPDGVDLTGWGEPLLNPYLPFFLESIEGVTFTTNGHFLDSRWAQRIVENKVGAVALSIDAARDETYISIHGLGDVAVVWENVAGLRKARDFACATLPTISLHFLLMKCNIKELVEFIERAADIGTDEVVAKHVAIFSRPGQKNEALFTGYFEDAQPDEALRDDMLAKATERASEVGITFRMVGSSVAKPVAGCFGEALTRPFVAANGSVSPCCVLAHEVPRLTPAGAPYPAPSLFFGNLRNDPLEAIWQIPEYKAFRDALASGDPPPQCRYCLGAWSVTVGTRD